MPESSEQQTVRASLKTQVLTLLLLCGAAGSASAATGHTICQTDACAVRAQKVDYTVTRDKSPAPTAEDREALKKSSLALTTERDTTVLRDQYVQSDLELPKFDDDVTDPVARLLERRSLQKDEGVDAETPAMKSALPGVDAEELRLFREKMYRTDI